MEQACSRQQNAFELRVDVRQSENEFTQMFTEETLRNTIWSLHHWDELTPAERSERVAKDGRGKKLYKLAKKFCVVELVTDEGEDDLMLLVERTKDGGIPRKEEYKIVTAREDWFEELKYHHEAGGHAKGKAFENRVHSRNTRIPRWALEVSIAA